MASENYQNIINTNGHGVESNLEDELNEKAGAIEEADSQVPLDVLSLSNLSDTRFEAGQYAKCIVSTDLALGLVKHSTNTGGIRQRLLVRKAKALLHLSKRRKARQLLKEIGPGEQSIELSRLVEGLKKWPSKVSSQSDLFREGLLRLPRMRPSHHDDAESQYTAELEESFGDDPVLSIMFCGVGDARHLFQTVIQYARKKKGDQKLHITMVDNKVTLMARNLILFSLLQEAVADGELNEAALTTVSYLYCAQVIPNFAWVKLQETIKSLVDKLRRKQQPLSFAYLPVPQMSKLVRVLKRWREGSVTAYSTSQTCRNISKSPPLYDEFGRRYCPTCVCDHWFFDHFSVLFPPEEVLEKLEPALLALINMSSVRGAQAHPVASLIDHLNKCWRVNVTLIDMEWAATRGPGEALDIGDDPPRIADMLTKQWKPSASYKGSLFYILRHVTDFFKNVSFGILWLQGRLMIEMVMGDTANALEQTRYGLLKRPKQEQDVTHTDWPSKYHAIHMGDNPNHVGGSLTSFLYAIPILREGAGSGLISRVPRNSPKCEDIDRFNAEHLLMHDQTDIRKHFSVKLSDGVTTKHQRWEKCERKSYPLEQLMPRESLSKWLFAHFLKICLPAPRPLLSLVHAPLNMMVFFKLLVQMAELGYPSHWLSSIIMHLGSGEIITAARAPRRNLLSPEDVDQVHSPRKICVQPWIAEFSTLVTQWRSSFPFAVVVPSGMLPSPRTIHEYVVELPWPSSKIQAPHLMMIFWNNPKYGEPPQDIYHVLLDDEKGDTTTSAQKIRGDGVHILSTFEWHMDKSAAFFWLKSDTIDLMVEEEWTIQLWRTDSWMRVTPGRLLKDVIFLVEH